MAATWIDLELVILSEVSLTEKYYISPIGGLLKKTLQMNVFTKQKWTQTKKQSCGNQKGGAGRDKLGVWD